MYYSGETGRGEEEEEDSRGKAAYADNGLCLIHSDFIGGFIQHSVWLPITSSYGLTVKSEHLCLIDLKVLGIGSGIAVA